MKKISLALFLLGALAIVPAPQNGGAFAAPQGNTTNNQASAQEAQIIQAVLAEVAAAVNAGDEQLATKILADAVKANPALAAKIITAFASSPAAASGAVNVTAIVANVAKSLQGQPGGDALAAAVLGAATPAAGNNANNNNNNNAGGKLPPALPKAGSNNGEGSNLPKENPNQTSPR